MLIMRWLALIILSLISFSCLEMDARIEINTNNGGILNLEYRLSREVDGILGTDPAQAPFIPVNRSDWEGEAGRISGLNLLSFTRQVLPKDVAISVRLSFQNNRALEDVFSRWGQQLSLISFGNSTQLNFEPRSFVEDLDLESLTLVKSLFGHYTVAITVLAPRIIAEDSKNNQSGQLSSWEFSIQDFYDLDLEEWRLVW
jgi:hypothetical protein